MRPAAIIFRIIMGISALAVTVHALDKLVGISFFINGQDPLGDAKEDVLNLIYLGLAGGCLASVIYPLAGLAILIVTQSLALFFARSWGLDDGYYPANMYDLFLKVTLLLFLAYDTVLGGAKLIRRKAPT